MVYARKLSIVVDGSVFYDFSFYSNEFKDSEAFKIAICDCDPGDNYEVKFENVICNHIHPREIRMSDCRFGCKIYKCEKCEVEFLSHNSNYGCKEGGLPIYL